MAKNKKETQFVCQSCGHTQSKWSGKCSSCNAYNTMEEERVEETFEAVNNKNRYAMTKLSGDVVDLSEVQGIDHPRTMTDINELDNVLGGGFVNGSVVLIGGEPGIGKSTILIQASEKMKNKNKKVLYVSGEESIQQVSLRAQRLNLNVKNIKIFSEVELEKILNKFVDEKPDFVIIDSIQTIFSSALSSAPGSVSQIKDCAARLARFAKENDITMVIVGHVTKDGDLAGPRVLEHIVDTVLYFEGEKDNTIRILRAFKNRFGSTNEIGIFSMTELGLEEMRDLGGTFLINQEPTIGAITFITQEGNRPILVEVQALLDQTQLPMPIKSAVGFDQKRLSMIMAIINKYLSITTYQYNVFVSIIGGLKTQDTTVDLPICLSMLSSAIGIPPMESTACFGEIGLTGELRVSFNYESKIKEAARLGMKNIIMPFIDLKKQKELENKYSIKLMPCKNIAQVAKEFKSFKR